ncbi:MAG: hypothetical protein V3T20_06995 [Gemmatimonadota bacterium]
MARTIMVLARLVQRPVVLDLHENYPVLMQSLRSGKRESIGDRPTAPRSRE